jgi:hypothetical protein
MIKLMDIINESIPIIKKTQSSSISHGRGMDAFKQAAKYDIILDGKVVGKLWATPQRYMQNAVWEIAAIRNGKIMPVKTIWKGGKKSALEWILTQDWNTLSDASPLTEMPQISRHGKKVTANGQSLKKMDLEAVTDNIVIFHSKQETFATPPGFTFVYFMDSDESVQDMKNHKIDYLIIHDRIRSDWNSAPIKDVWKKAKANGQEHILGVVQGVVDDKEIYIDKMSVRPGYKKNSINTKMIQELEKTFPGRKLGFSGPTKDGAEFIQKYTGKPWKAPHGWQKPEF